MRSLLLIRSLATLLAACTAAALAAPTTPAPVAKTASGPSIATTQPGTAPAAGGNGGSLSINGGNTAGQVKPKLPKCPDPLNNACPAVKAPGK